MSINDDIFAATGGPTINDGLAKHFGKTQFESLADAERRWLLANGATGGALSTLWQQALAAGGFKDHKDFWSQGGTFVEAAPNPTTYLNIAGVNSRYATAPADAALVPDGSFDVRIKAAIDWDNVTQQYMSTFTLASRGWSFRQLLTSHFLQIIVSSNGTVSTHVISSTVGVHTVFSGSELGWVRGTYDVDNDEVKFYTSSDGEVWDQLGATVSVSLAVPFQSVADHRIGASHSGSDPIRGTLHYASIRDLGGSIINEFDASGEAGQSSFVGDQGQTWSMVGGATLVDV